MKKHSTYPMRVRFAKEIIAEILLPERQTRRVAILAIGLPSSPHKKEALQFLADQGYVAILPRYRGTWESEGSFLEKSPALDIRDIIAELEGESAVTDLYTGEIHSIRVTAVHLFGASFGGPAVLLNSHLPLVKKVIALAPVLDWRSEGESEPFPFFVRFTRDAFGDAFRPRHPKDWQKLTDTTFYNPLDHTAAIVGNKILIIHAKDDTVVPCQPLVTFAEKTGARYYLKPHGGHLSLTSLTERFYWKKIAAFLHEK